MALFPRWAPMLVLFSLIATGVEPQRVVSIRIKNPHIWPVKVELQGNVLSISPLRVNYVQFPAGSRAYVYDPSRPQGRGRLLFEITAQDEGRQFLAR